MKISARNESKIKTFFSQMKESQENSLGAELLLKKYQGKFSAERVLRIKGKANGSGKSLAE